jgi:hypothetical protein
MTASIALVASLLLVVPSTANAAEPSTGALPTAVFTPDTVCLGSELTVHGAGWGAGELTGFWIDGPPASGNLLTEDAWSSTVRVAEDGTFSASWGTRADAEPGLYTGLSFQPKGLVDSMGRIDVSVTVERCDPLSAATPTISGSAIGHLDERHDAEVPVACQRHRDRRGDGIHLYGHFVTERAAHHCRGHGFEERIRDDDQDLGRHRVCHASVDADNLGDLRLRVDAHREAEHLDQWHDLHLPVACQWQSHFRGDEVDPEARLRTEGDADLRQGHWQEVGPPHGSQDVVEVGEGSDGG